MEKKNKRKKKRKFLSLPIVLNFHFHSKRVSFYYFLYCHLNGENFVRAVLSTSYARENLDGKKEGKKDGTEREVARIMLWELWEKRTAASLFLRLRSSRTKFFLHNWGKDGIFRAKYDGKKFGRVRERIGDSAKPRTRLECRPSMSCDDGMVSLSAALPTAPSAAPARAAENQHSRSYVARTLPDVIMTTDYHYVYNLKYKTRHLRRHCWNTSSPCDGCTVWVVVLCMRSLLQTVIMRRKLL